MFFYFILVDLAEQELDIALLLNYMDGCGPGPAWRLHGPRNAPSFLFVSFDEKMTLFLSPDC